MNSTGVSLLHTGHAKRLWVMSMTLQSGTVRPDSPRPQRFGPCSLGNLAVLGTPGWVFGNLITQWNGSNCADSFWHVSQRFFQWNSVIIKHKSVGFYISHDLNIQKGETPFWGDCSSRGLDVTMDGRWGEGKGSRTAFPPALSISYFHQTLNNHHCGLLRSASRSGSLITLGPTVLP